MRPIRRIPLADATQLVLQALTEKVDRAKDPRVAAARLWRTKPALAFADVRSKLAKMASGRSRCMYCEDSFGTDIEHFYPRAQYPRHAFTWTNYLLACSHCNSNRKRNQFPFLDRRPALINPTKDDPSAHLVFLPSTGDFVAIGPKGQPSIDVFGLNDQVTPRKLPQARKAAFLKLQLLLEEYASRVSAGDAVGADFVQQTVVNEPFQAVLSWLVQIAATAAAPAVLRPRIPSIMADHEVATWL